MPNARGATGETGGLTVEKRFTVEDVRAAWERGFIVGNTAPDGRPHDPYRAQVIETWAKAGANYYATYIAASLTPNVPAVPDPRTPTQ